jgi:uncharacterized protein
MLIDPYFDAIAAEFLRDGEYQTLQNYVAHGGWTVYDHSLHVAAASYLYGRRHGLDLDYRALIRGALLHDYYLYDWHRGHKKPHLHGFRHPGIALHNASRRFPLGKKERNIIHSHMFPLTFWIWPLSREAWLVSVMDTAMAYKEMAVGKNAFSASPLRFCGGAI